MASGFQTQVAVQPAPAEAGDFAGHNPRVSVLAGPGGLVAGSSGVTVGRFAWSSAQYIDADGAPSVVNNTGSGAPTGFVHREQQALITTYLADASMVVPAGYPVTLMSAGDYWVKNDSTTTCTVGMTCYANYADGKALFAAAGSPGVATATSFSVAAATNAFTGSVVGNVLTVTAVSSGNLYLGTIVSGGVASGTMIVAQLTSTETGGTLRLKGTYAVSIPEQNVTSQAMTGTYCLFTTTTVTAGNFAVGQTLTASGTAFTANSYITDSITGTGGSGSTFAVTPSQTAATTTATGASSVATKYIAMSNGLTGELVKITSWLLG